MTRHAIPSRPAACSLTAGLAASLAIALAAAPASAAGLDLPGGCAVAGSASPHEGPSSFEAGRLEVVVPGADTAPPPSLHAAQLHASLSGAGAVSTAQLEQASTAAAAALLTALSGHHTGACPDHVLRDAMQPLARGLQGGGGYEFTWTDVAIRAGSTRFGVRHLSLRLASAGVAARLTASLDGILSNDPAAALLPDSLDIHAALPADELPDLASATGGHGRPVDVTIEQAVARRGDTVLSGHGQARVASTAEDSSGQGHVTAQGYDALLEAAAGIDRVRTALFLAQLVGHRKGDHIDWDLAWQGGTLLVNNVPLPLR